MHVYYYYYCHCHYQHQGCTNLGKRVIAVTKLFMVAPKICGALVILPFWRLDF